MKAYFLNTPFILFTGNLVNNKDEVNKFKVLRNKGERHTTVIAASRITHVGNRPFSKREYDARP